MKRKIFLSIAMVLTVMMPELVNSHSTAKAQPVRVFVGDSGIIALGPNQVLRITVANGLDPATVRFRRLEYTAGSCAGAVCKHLISSQTVSDSITLAPGEGASYNEGDTATQVRVVVSTNRQEVKVKALIINASTGAVVGFFDIFIE